MIEPEYKHLRAVERVFFRRRGFRQLFDEITFSDDRDESEIPEDEEWTRGRCSTPRTRLPDALWRLQARPTRPLDCVPVAGPGPRRPNLGPSSKQTHIEDARCAGGHLPAHRRSASHV
jgi:hypothetical protein